MFDNINVISKNHTEFCQYFDNNNDNNKAKILKKY